MPPIVSVVIPAYNARLWIQETLASVLRQTYPAENIELIVVDDASQDDSALIASAFLKEHRLRGRVIALEHNVGCGGARNVGWEAAQGEWIQFLDADDILAPEKLELQVASAAQAAADVAVIYSNWQHLSLCDNVWEPAGPVSTPFVDENPAARILEEPTFGYVGPTLIRRSWVAHVGGFEVPRNVGEDITLMMGLAMAGGRFSKTAYSGPLFFYRQTPNSLWRQSITQVEPMRNLMRAFRRTELFLRSQMPEGLPERVCLALAGRYLKHVEFFLQHDPATFGDIVEWVSGLELKTLPHVGEATRLVSTVVGYNRALRLRATFRQYRGNARRFEWRRVLRA
jgi:glycosyltransferase involved in cell wall biosynthesis